MSAWLSADWAGELAAALDGWPPPGPAPLALTVTVAGGPDGDVTGEHRLWADGDGAGRELALTLPAEQARAVLDGELSPSVAFMRGSMKTSGDLGAVLEVLEAAASPAGEDVRTRVALFTD